MGRHVPTLESVNDAKGYYVMAENLAAGRGYIRPFDFLESGASVPTAEFPPLFPGLLAVARLAGIDTILGQKLLLAVIGCATVVLVGLAGRLAGSPTTGLVAAGLAAIHPAFFLADGALAAESLFLLLTAGALVLALRLSAGATWPWWAGFGLVAGAAALTRSEALLWVLLVVVPLARGRIRLAAVAAGAVLVVVVPWSVRNAVRLDHVVPVSNNLGSLVAGANCDETYEGRFTGLWLLRCFDAVDVAGLDETERARAFLGAGADYATDHPGRAVAVGAVRVLRTWGLWDPTGQLNWETFEGRDRRWAAIAYRMHLVLLAFAVLGAIGTKRAGRPLWPIAAFAVAVALTSLVSYGNQRFRAGAEPAIAVLAAVALSNFVALGRPWRPSATKFRGSAYWRRAR